MTENESRLAQALRELFETWLNSRPSFRTTTEVKAAWEGWKANTAVAAMLAAHERAQPASVADGYAYSCADGFLRVNQGAPVNGGKPIDAIPFYFAPPPAQPASVPDGWVMVPREPTVEMLRAEDSACPDRGNENRDPYAWGRASWAAFLAAAPQAKAKGDDHGN